MMPDSLGRAQRVAETVLREQLNDVVFDRILVKPDNDRFYEDDGEYVAVKALYEGRRERLRSERTSQLRRILRESLLDEGVTEFPVLYLIMKSEWDRHPDPARPLIWRRGRDSNPRYAINVHTLSRRAP